MIARRAYWLALPILSGLACGGAPFRFAFHAQGGEDVGEGPAQFEAIEGIDRSLAAARKL